MSRARITGSPPPTATLLSAPASTSLTVSPPKGRSPVSIS
jgi:hypothetical protein